MKRRAPAIVLCAFMASCGGGSGDSGAPPAGNSPPLAAPAIAYRASSLALTTGVPLVALAPTNTGGAVATWSVAPALPAGLALNATNGTIDGTPTASSSSAAYVVRAENSAGASTHSLTIAVESGVVLELGHATDITFARYDDTRILSGDNSAHWVLWNAQTATIVAKGDSDWICWMNLPCGPFLDLAGPTFVVKMNERFELRASSDGSVLGSVAAPPPTSPSWWQLAKDGSYLAVAEKTNFVGGTKASLTVWSPTGAVLLSRDGDYSNTRAFAAPGELRIALGPQGESVIENIAVPTGTSTLTPPFAGNFHSWFGDGARFLTNIHNTVYVFSKDAVQQDLHALPTVTNVAGYGNWFWYQSTTGTAELQIHAVGDPSSTPTLSYPRSSAISSGSALAVMRSPEPDVVVDLSGLTLPPPVEYSEVDARFAFAAASATRWVVANRVGQLVDVVSTPGTPRYFGIGGVWALVGSPQRVAIALARGDILYFDAASKTQEGRIAFAAGDLEMSADGTILFASARSPSSSDWTLKVFALPFGQELASWPYPSSGTPKPHEISLSPSGQLFGKVLDAPSLVPHRREVTKIDGTLMWWDTFDPPPSLGFQEELQIHFSPDDTHIAVATSASKAKFASAARIYTNFMLAGAANGWPVGWIDDSRLLVNRYRDGHAEGSIYTEAVIVGPTGIPLGTVALPELTELQSLGAERIYSAARNTVYSVTTGSPLWTSPNPTRGIGAVGDGRVWFVSSGTVRAEPL